EYIDNETASYGAIFDNVVGKGTESDFQRVVTAIKALSEGRQLETYFDVDAVLRYLAAHTIVVNLDSYSSGMAQNYFIYEREGKLTILPWDYNLAWRVPERQCIRCREFPDRHPGKRRRDG
ncbi:MAG TPA: CotH kinase family protein, partial [Bacillota bacterium]|nr:CotH kinase family protein [Bacillota bacterium]